MEKDFIIYNGKKYDFYIIRKNIKNINMRIHSNKEIIISIPKKITNEYVKRFVLKKIKWIQNKQEFYEKILLIKESLNFENGETVYILGNQYRMIIKKAEENQVFIKDNYVCIQVKEKYFSDKKYIEKMYNTWIRLYSINILKELVIQYQGKLNKYNIPIPNIEIRKMKTRWGTCIPLNKKVIFNLSVIKVPKCCIEYVVLHELAHFKYMNHSKDFYNFITIFMPDWKERKKLLDEKYSGLV